MTALLEEYIEIDEAERLGKRARTKKERNATRWVVLETNCLVRFRGWHNEEEKNKVLSALEQKRVYFSTALGYNDPYDTLLYIDKRRFLWNILDDLKNMPAYTEKLKSKSPERAVFAQLITSPSNPKKSELKQRFLGEVTGDVEDLREQIHSNIKGICFSQNFCSILMWAHYAHNHQGIALLYDKRELTKARCFDKDGNEIKKFFNLREIAYRKKKVDATEFVNAYLLNKYRDRKGAETFDTGIIWPQPSRQTLEEIITTKDESWAYEQEVRLIPRYLGFEKESDIAYLDIKPRAIILGAKMREEDKRRVVEIARKLGGIALYEAALNPDQPDYNVSIEECCPVKDN